MLILPAGAERFQVGNNAPSVHNLDGRGERRLSSIGDTVADLLEKHAFRKGLNLYSPQVRGKGLKTLSYGSIAVMIFSVALGTIGEI